jgi:hypothetical protein
VQSTPPDGSEKSSSLPFFILVKAASGVKKAELVQTFPSLK